MNFGSRRSDQAAPRRFGRKAISTCRSGGGLLQLLGHPLYKVAAFASYFIKVVLRLSNEAPFLWMSGDYASSANIAALRLDVHRPLRERRCYSQIIARCMLFH